MSAESKEPELEPSQSIEIDSHRIFDKHTETFQVLDPFSNSKYFGKKLRDMFINPDIQITGEELERIVYRFYSRMKYFDPMILQSLILLGKLQTTYSERIHIELTNPKLTPLSREVLKKVILRVSEETYTEFERFGSISSKFEVPQLPSQSSEPSQLFKQQEKIREREQQEKREKREQEQDKTVPESLKQLMIDVFGFTLDFQGKITFESSDWKSMIAGTPEYQEHRMELMTYFGRYTNFKGHIQLLSYPYIQLPGNRMTHDEPLRELYKEFLKSSFGKYTRNIIKEQEVSTFKGLKGLKELSLLEIPVEKEGSLKMNDFIKLGFKEYFTFIPGRTNFLNIQSYLQRTDIPGGKISVSFI
jgi:hypothetical protein